MWYLPQLPSFRGNTGYCSIIFWHVLIMAIIFYNTGRITELCRLQYLSVEIGNRKRLGL